MMHRDINNPAKTNSILGYILFRLTVGVVLLVTFVYFFIEASITEQRIEFNHLVANSEARLQERLIINEAALSGFANLLQINGSDDLEPIRDYTKQMRSTYNQIYMFEALIGINPNDQERFSQKMQAAGSSDYKVYRYVSRNSTTGKPSKPFNYLADTGVMFPVFFIDPEKVEVQGLLGFDMMSAKVPREPLIEALVSGDVQATKPYELYEGGMGYVLYKPLKQVQKDTGADAVGTLVATIIVLIDPMLTLAHESIPRAEVSLKYGKQPKLVSKTLYPKSEDAPIWSTGTLTREIKFDKYGQMFTLSIVQTVGLYPVQMYFLVALIALLLICFGLYLRSSVGKRNNGLQRDKALQQLAYEHNLLEDRVIERTAELQLTSDENQRLANQIIRLQEDHSKHLARELHDDFGQMLTAIKINAHMIGQKELDEQSLRYAQEIITYSDNLYDKVQDLMQFLRPAALDAFGLKATIKSCISQFKLIERDIHLDLQVDEGVDAMEEAYSIATYRIVQELVNNTVKHSKASTLQVLVKIQNSQSLLIQVTDNGKGINKLRTDKQFGCRGLSERVHILGGTLDHINLATGGLQVKVTLPYKPV